MDYLDRAAKELQDIAEQEKALNERKAKLRAFAEMGADLFGLQAPTSVGSTLNADNRKLAVAATPKHRKGTAKALVEQSAQQLLSTSEFVQTNVVLMAAEAAGARIGAADKLLAVSAILSRCPLFQNDRSKGWSLVEKKPESAPTLPGFGVADAT